MLPDYVGQQVDIAKDDAEDRSFKIIVNDSIHKLGVAGGEILSQNPKPSAEVKEDRKVYVTVAKYIPDFVMSENLPEFYGRSFEMKRTELMAQEIDLVVKGYKYDVAEPNMILEAWYGDKQIVNRLGKKKGIKIEKGTRIEVILSESDNGSIDIPDLRCKTIGAARLLMAAKRLKINDIILEGIQEGSVENAYVTRQVPASNSATTVAFGTGFVLYVSSELPQGCN